MQFIRTLGVSAIRPSGIDLNLLPVLFVLLQTRSVTGAARKLGISQPAVSRSLAQLREAFQDPLMIRTNRGMELTHRGEELIAPIQDWLTTTTSLFTTKTFDPQTLDRKFRIASTDFGVLSVIAPALPAFRAQAPRAAMDIVPFSDTMIAKLSSGELDLIVTGMEPDLSATYGHHLFTAHCSCVTRAGHPALDGEAGPMSIERFLQWPHISVMVGETSIDRVNLLLGEAAARRRIPVSLPYFHVAPHLLGTSDAILTLPDRLARTFEGDARFAVVPAPAEIASFDYWVLWHERSRRDPATMWVVDLLADACAASAGQPLPGPDTGRVAIQRS